MIFRFADCTLDSEQMLLTRSGELVAVEPQVFDLVQLLVQNPNRVVTRDEIVEKVWRGRIVSESAISARIAAARKAVGDNGKEQTIIRTIARRGLAMATEVTTGKPAQTTRPDAAPHIRYTKNAARQSLGYAVSGSGPALVRSGYVMTDIQAEWNVENERQFLERVQSGHQLLRFDPVGFGQSRRPTTEVSFDQMAEEIGAVADAAGLERFALYSESGGVHPALRFAAKYPHRVSSLIIVGGYVQGRMLREGAPEHDPIRGMIAEGWRNQGAGFSAGYLLSYFPEGPLEVVQQSVALMHSTCSPEQIIQQRDAINHVDNSALLPLIKCPTLIIHGRGDGVHPLSEARKLASGIAGAELVVLDTANHLPLFGNPVWEDYVAGFLDFLELNAP